MDIPVLASEKDKFNWEYIYCKCCKQDVPGWLTMWAAVSPLSLQEGFKPCWVIPLQICPFCGNIAIGPVALDEIVASIKVDLGKILKN